MKNMMRRKKKRGKKKSCVLDYCDQQNAYNICYPTLNKMEMTSEMFEGQLYKYTNVMKGWQFRWFILDPKKGILNYYLNESERKQQPRGWVNLEAAVISPSDEDSNTFTVNSTSGEMFKLRAQDARARQEWVNRLRAVAELHTNAIAQKNPPLPIREHPSSLSSLVPSPASCSLALWDAFSAVREHLFRAEQSHFMLARTIEDLPSSGNLRHTDPELLVLKAASQAMLLSLSQCLMTLQQQQQQPLLPSSSAGPFASDCRTSPHCCLPKNQLGHGGKSTDSSHAKKKHGL